MHIPFIERQGEAIRLIVDDQPFTMLAGEFHNSTSSNRIGVNRAWETARKCHMNSVIATVSWELVEPQEGIFDFSTVDRLLSAAKEAGLRLALIWFGTWKNGQSTYVPSWVKCNTERFQRARDRHGAQSRTISCLCENTMRADARAFAKFMEHLRDTDEQRVVIAIQVHNEVGFLGSSRDFGRKAEDLFRGRVPVQLLERVKDTAKLHPRLRDAIRPVQNDTATWEAVFGPLAQEAFMAYYTAGYVETITAEGKRIYPLPCFVNAWPVQYKNELPGSYPSGGPVDHMHDIWRLAAPSIDIFAADLYLENFAEECANYTRIPGNPLFVPETRKDKWAPAYAFYAVGKHNAVCISPFGFDSINQPVNPADLSGVQEVVTTIKNIDITEMLASTYQVIQNLLPTLHHYGSLGETTAVLQDRIRREGVVLGGYILDFCFDGGLESMSYPAGGLAIALGSREFIIAGFGFNVQFHPTPERNTTVDFRSIEEGRFEGLEWRPELTRNGDELYVRMESQPKIMRVALYEID